MGFFFDSQKIGIEDLIRKNLYLHGKYSDYQNGSVIAQGMLDIPCYQIGIYSSCLLTC